MRHDVLVVEDEAGLLRGIVRGLGADPTIHVEGVETVGRAEEVLDSSPPDLLITDIRLPGRSGLDLLLELEKRALRIPVLVMTSYKSAYEDQLASRSGLEVLEKPVPLATLRRLVKKKLQESQAAPPLAPFGLEDYLQLASLSRHSLRFEISLPDSISGHLEVVDGELWNATCGEATADDALRTMLDSPSCDITCRDLTEQPSDRHFQGSTQGVLLDLARRDDEKRRDEDEPGESTFDLEDEFAGAIQPPPMVDEARAPAPTLRSADPLQSSYCDRMVAEIRGATACAVLDRTGEQIHARCLVDARGSSPFPSASGMAAVGLLLLAASDPKSTERAEVLVTLREDLALAHLDRELDLILLLEATSGMSQGLAWRILRDSSELRGTDIRSRGEPLDRPSPTEEPGALDPSAVDPIVSQVCLGLRSTITGARELSVVDYSGGSLLGSSDSPDTALRGLATPLPGEILTLFRLAHRRSEPIEEVYVSGGDHWWFAGIPESTLAVTLLAERRLQPGVARAGLRSAVDLLVNARR